ncbi:MAG: HAMP domain-containing sensor histidine kinase [Acidimicrobiia bacterium]
MRAPVEAQRRFHRYVAVLFAVTFPTLAVLEIAGMDMKSPLAPIRWASYLVLAIWAIWLTQRRDADSMLLVLTTIWFFGTLSVVEGLFHIEVSAFDFTTTFGLIMMLAVLAGTLSSGSRVVWSVAAGVAVAVWSVTMGVLDGQKVEVVAIRAVTALAGVVFTTALVSKLYDQLSESISRYEKATRLQHAIATCSESLLVQTDTFAIYEALKALLVATDADYTYVDRNTEVDDEVHWEIIADAHRKAEGAAGGWKDGVYREESSTYRALAAGRAIAIHTDQLTGEDRAEYVRDGIVTELTVPIFVGDEFRGSIGFVEYTDDRQWTEDEVTTLWRASHMIGAYWRRQDDQEQLRASNDSKDKLLASVSHEIRTPLTAIVGLSEEIVASRTSLGGEELDELNGIIAVQSRELAELVEDLLVASRAEFGNLSIKPQDMSLMTEVENVARGIRESHPTDKVIAIGGDSDVVAWADPLRCRQVIRNLLTNAIRYGGTHIAVVVRRLGDQAQVVVIDDGEGVSEAEAELIFERYYRSDQSPTQPGSVGIGLAVSRQLAEMMGGTLRYVGADGEPRFELSLPVGAALDAVSTAELSVTA